VKYNQAHEQKGDNAGDAPDYTGDNQTFPGQSHQVEE
jgi:hypothetical protein